MEAALAAETKRRVDSTTTLHDKCRTMVYDMESRLKSQIENDNKYMTDRLNNLENRIQQLEDRFQHESSQHMEYVQNKAEDFNTTLVQLQREQDIERKSRIKREQRLVHQVETGSKALEELYLTERSERTTAIATLARKIELQQTSKTQQEEMYTQRVNEALESLQNEMASEINERQQQDDEIVNALNRYIQQLQYSLSILSSD